MHRRTFLTVGLVLAVTCTALEALATATTMPAAVKDVGGLSLYGWTFTAFMLTNLIGIAVAGVEADRQGPTRPFLAGVALFSVGLCIAGFAQSIGVVIAGRAVQGLGSGMLGSLAYVAIGRGYPEGEKARVLAIISTAWVVPGLIGPAIAGVVSQYLGWRWVFLGIAPLPILAAALVVPALRSLRSVEGASPRDWGRITASVQLGLGAALATSASSVTSAIAAAAMAVAGLVVAWRALRRLMPAGTLRAAAGLPAVLAAGALVSAGFFGVDAYVPLSLTAVRGQSVALGGLPLTSATLGWTAGAWVQARLTARVRREVLLESGLGGVGIGVVGAALVLLSGVPTATATLAWAVAGLGMGVAYSTISLAILQAATGEEAGRASSSLQLANVLGSALGTGAGEAALGLVGAGGGQVRTSLAIQDALMLAVLALAAVVGGRVSQRANGE